VDEGEVEVEPGVDEVAALEEAEEGRQEEAVDFVVEVQVGVLQEAEEEEDDLLVVYLVFLKRLST